MGLSTTPLSLSAVFLRSLRMATSALMASSVAEASPAFLAALSAATLVPWADAAASAAAISSGVPVGSP